MTNKWLPATAVLLVIILCFYFYRKYRVAPDIKLDKLELTGLSGQEISMAEFQGQKVILCFSASWCGNCRVELNEMMEADLPEDVKVVVVSDEDPERIAAFKERGKYPFLFLRLEKPFRDLGIHAIPTSYLLNKDLKIKKETVGYVQWKDPSTKQHLLKLMES
jgi:peroxiredoxin